MLARDLSLRVFRPRSSSCATTTTISIPRSTRTRRCDHAALDRAYADLVEHARHGAQGRELRRDVARGDRSARTASARWCASRSRRRSTISARCASSGAATTRRRSRSPNGSGCASARSRPMVYDDVVLFVAMKPRAEIGSQRERRRLQRAQDPARLGADQILPQHRRAPISTRCFPTCAW